MEVLQRINHNSFNGETKYYFLETNYFNLILIFIIGENIIIIIRFFKIIVNHGSSFLQIKIKVNAIRFRRRQKEKSFSVLCYRFSCICLQMSCFIYKFADAKIVH